VRKAFEATETRKPSWREIGKEEKEGCLLLLTVSMVEDVVWFPAGLVGFYLQTENDERREERRKGGDEMRCWKKNANQEEKKEIERMVLI